MGIRRHNYYWLLSFITIGLVTWQYFGMRYTLHFALEQGSPVYFSKDVLLDKKAKGFVLKQADKVTLFCQTPSTAIKQVCNLRYLLAANPEHPLDLSNFDQISLDISLHNPKHETMVVDLVNQEQGQFESQQRINRHITTLNAGRHTYQLPLHDFHVPLTWLVEDGKPTDSSRRVDSTVYLNLSSAYQQENTNLELSLYSISFSGKWFDAEYLYLSLLAIWFVSVSSGYIAVHQRVKQQDKHSQLQAEEQEKINRFLSIERDNYEFMAKIDPLTNCLNRAGMRDIFSEIIMQYAEIGIPASLVIFDIDHFKRINDTFGHDEGDKVLVNISKLVRQYIREDDHLARWGGEEFIVVCRHTRDNGAAALAEHLRKKIEDTVLTEKSRITSSFGVAEINSPHLEDWIKQADEALYKAKEAGRNRVVQA